MEPVIIYGNTVRIRAKHRRAMRRKELQREPESKAYDPDKELRERVKAWHKADRLNDRVGRAVKNAEEEAARKPEKPAARAKHKAKWYIQREDENYIHCKAPRNCGERPLDRIRYN